MDGFSFSMVSMAGLMLQTHADTPTHTHVVSATYLLVVFSFRQGHACMCLRMLECAYECACVCVACTTQAMACSTMLVHKYKHTYE